MSGLLHLLPPEVLTHSILAFIPHNSLIHLRLVCSEFDHFIWDYWKCTKTSYLIHFRMFDQQFIRIAQTYLSKLPKLRSITLQNLEEANQRFYDLEGDGLIKGLSYLNNIEYLDCHKLIKVKPSFVEELAEGGDLANTVTELVLPQFWAKPIHLDFTPFKKLKRLSFVKGVDEGFVGIAGIQFPPSLEYFMFGFTANNQILEPLSQCKNLKEIVLPEIISWSSISKLLKHLDLNSIIMRGVDAQTFPLQESTQFLTNVNTLQFTASRFNLKPLQSLKYLENLTINFSRDKNIDLLHSALSGLTNLKSIDFTFDEDTNYESKKTFPPVMFSKLHTLKIKNCLSSKAIMSLIVFLCSPSLKEISLCDEYIYDDIVSSPLLCLKNCPLLEKMVIDLPSSYLLDVFKFFKESNTVKLKVLKGYSFDEKLIDMCPNKHTVEELETSNNIVEALDLREFSNLRKMTLNNHDEDVIIELPNSLQHLKIENLHSSSNILKQIARLPFLKTLNLVIHNLRDEDLIEMIENMDDNPPISSLIIRYSEHLTNSIIGPLERKMVNLTTVLIDDCPKIRDCGEITLLEYEKRFVFSSIYSEFEQPPVERLHLFVKNNLGNLDGTPETIITKMKSQIELLTSSGKLTELYFTLVEFISRGYLSGADCKTTWFFYKHIINTYTENQNDRSTQRNTQRYLIDRIIHQISDEFMDGHREEILDCLSKNLHRFFSRFSDVAIILLNHNRYEQVLKYLPFVGLIRLNPVCQEVMKLFVEGKLRLLDYYSLSIIERVMDLFCRSGISVEYVRLLESFFQLVVQTYLIKTPSFPNANDLDKLDEIQNNIVQHQPAIENDYVDNYVQRVAIPSSSSEQMELSIDELVRLFSPHFAESEYTRINISPNEFKTKKFTIEGHEWLLSIDESVTFKLILSKPKLESGILFGHTIAHCCIIFPSGMTNFHVFTNKFIPQSDYSYNNHVSFPEEPFILCMKIVESKYYTVEEITSLLGDKTIQEPEVKALITKSAWLARKIHKNRLVQYKNVRVITTTDLSDHAFASQEMDIFGSKHILYIRPNVEGYFYIDFGTYLSSSPHLKLSYLIANETLDEESIAISKINKPLYETHDLNFLIFGYENIAIRGKSNIFEQGIYKPKIITKENGNTYYQFTVHLVIVLEDSLIGFEPVFSTNRLAGYDSSEFSDDDDLDVY
ncbi:Hypothetical protein NAEGRDRAFT_74620 [Naegleria gruberi]|uniref:F-box domain-containing protein n=1 Tax=Naegleria gruberi TaxID=5762 RepID=D2VZU4_NAEGR|nr:uncharacterized protein NAEGRDRAFT_74620 [Naegleria gruberi]EFC37632.1 Hypothetical protein NAEGRDRAFT_74620 [Naegleria gruberi]|eukprot:XP_002670376.1 Hypothetical protein NAEGRDRAFT_74620 [Naegleria gruberi strain NEG-M]